MIFRAAKAACLTAVFLALGVPRALGQSSFVETFDNVGTVQPGEDGPSGLMSRGFIFRNQSSPRGIRSWFAGYTPDVQPLWPAPQAGAGYIAVDGESTDHFGGRVSNWMILPHIDQQAGDTLTFYVYDLDSNNAPTVEVRYSPNGGTSTGSSATSVGDFTTVLLNIDPIPRGGWIRYQAPLPGTGRIAFRYFIDSACNFGCAAAYTGIDTLSVGTPPPPPCNLPPVPGAGQTVTWTAAESPYEICSNILIPAGGTVIIEPGVTVNVLDQSTLTISGTVRAIGTPAGRIAFNANAVFPPAVEVTGGTFDAAFVDIRGQFRPSADGQIMIRDSAFIGPTGRIYSPLYASNGFASIERTTFFDSELTIGSYTVVLRDITLNNTFARLGYNHLFFDRVDSNGGGVDLGAWSGQPMLVDALAVRNAPYGVSLAGGNFFIGPDVTLEGNTYPVRLDGGGILEGSRLPSTGNVNNLIFVPGGDTSGGDTWADAGLPYFVNAAYTQRGSPLDIMPGVQVQVSGSAGMAAQSIVRVLGTAERPVRFGPAAGGAPWFPLQNFYRIRHAELTGAIRAAAWPAHLGWGFIDSSTVSNCTEIGVTGQVQVRKTRILNNTVGASVGFNSDLLGITNRNSFVGNGQGVAAASDARYNWWGSPTGPLVISNPGGSGDTVASGIPYQPFATVEPDFGDAPPVVDLEKHSFLARPGEKMFLTWKARDDGTIVSQRVLMSLDGDIVQGNLSEPIRVLADNLGPGVRSIEFVVPEPAVRFFGAGNIRVEATDNAGQVGWDDIHLYMERDEPGRLVLNLPGGQTYTAGQLVGDICWTPEGINPVGGSINAYLLLENTGTYISLGGVTTYLQCLSGQFRAPFVSTDRARIVLSLFTGGGVDQPEYYYGEPFAIRPDTRVGDTPPTVQLTSPAPGSSYPGGSAIPLRWSAADDQFVRAFHVQASYDSGRTWHLIARDLPGTSTGYDWRLPASVGIPDVRVKVVAVDRRFQDTASIIAVSVTPGSGGPDCPADFNADGTLTSQDFFEFLIAFFAQSTAADFNDDGLVNSQDIFDFLGAFFSGC